MTWSDLAVHDWLIEVYSQKCQALCVTSKRTPVKSAYSIQGQILEEANKAKYLGVTIQNTLSWNQHIDTTAKKASNTTAFLQRNLQQCPRRTRPTIKNFLFAVTLPTQKNCPYPKNFIGLPETDFFFISFSQIQFFNFCIDFPSKMLRMCFSEREMNWNNCHSLL